MKPILIAPLLGIAFLFPVAAQDTGARTQPGTRTIQRTPAEREADRELNKAAYSYREGDFVAAQQHSEKALALDPSSKTAASFIARTIHAQYQPGIYSEANKAKAREAIDAYKQVSVQDPLNDESYKAIAYLYEALKDDVQHQQWVFQRALDLNVSPDKRAEAYGVLASKAWDCSFKITELPNNKTVSSSNLGSPKIRYSKPQEVAEFERARQCAANGLDMTEAAIALAPDNLAAWSYKTNLLLELSKLAEMDNNLSLKVDYLTQLKVATSTVEELSKRQTTDLSNEP